MARPFSSTLRKRRGILNVSYAALHNLLELPEEAKILRVTELHPGGTDTVSLIIESKYLDETVEGGVLPVIRIHDLGGFDE
jgi:hypothetical protein